MLIWARDVLAFSDRVAHSGGDIVERVRGGNNIEGPSNRTCE